MKKKFKVSKRKRTIFGTAEKPRLSVYKSLGNIYIQAIDDDLGKTLAYASSLDKEVNSDGKNVNIDIAKSVGKLIAKRMKEKGILNVVFDRGNNRYHGKIKSLADGAREEGLIF